MLKKIILIILSIGVALALSGYIILLKNTYYNSSMLLGVSFSSEYAGYLHLDPAQVFTAILDEWQFKHIRLAAQWDKIEKTPGTADFAELDAYLGAAAQRGARIILAVGQKTPRWPECHVPGWAQQLPPKQYRQALDNYIALVVERYKKHPALEIWQVENEPFLPFGGSCANFNPRLLSAEVALVKKLDAHHPTLVTDSGELSTWRKTARAADLFGTTMYRVVWHKYIGYFNYDWIPAAFYRLKLRLMGRSVTSAYVVELQAEPWMANKEVADSPLSEQYQSMNLARLQKNIDYARRVGLPRAYLWGAEWWYWLRAKGHAEISNYIKGLPKE